MEVGPYTPSAAERPSDAPTYRLPEADGTLSDGWIMSGPADAEVVAFSRPNEDRRYRVRGVDRETYQTLNNITPHTPQEIANLSAVTANQVISIRPGRIFEQSVCISHDENGRPQASASEGVQVTLCTRPSPDGNADTDMSYIASCAPNAAMPDDLTRATCAALRHNTHELYRLLTNTPPHERRAVYDRMTTTLKPTWEQLEAVLPHHIPDDSVNVVRTDETVAEAGWSVVCYERLDPEGGVVDRYMVTKDEGSRQLIWRVSRKSLDAGNPVQTAPTSDRA